MGKAKGLGRATGVLLLALFASCKSKDPRRAEADRAFGYPSLLVMARDEANNPVEGCTVLIREQQIGATTDKQGRGRIANVSPGSWLVSWRTTGAMGDSARIKFVAGQEETLRALVRFEAESPNPYDERHQ
jgi:hypothetical protein